MCARSNRNQILT